MNIASKKVTVFALCALSLPTLYAGDKPVAPTKLTEEQNNKLNTAFKIVGGVVVVAALGAAVYAVSKGVRAQSRLSDSGADRSESNRG